MKLISMHVFRWKPEEAILLAGDSELSALWFYQRSVASDLILHNSRLVASRMKPGQRACIRLEGGKTLCYAICTPGQVCVTAITDLEYPERAAFAALYDLAMDFIRTYKSDPKVLGASADLRLEYKGLQERLVKWQKPEENDKLLAIEKELQETTDIMRQALEGMLKKGEKLEEIAQKSKDLKGISLQVYNKAKKNNQCCSLY